MPIECQKWVEKKVTRPLATNEKGRRVAKRIGKFGNNTTELEYYFGIYFK